MTRPSPGPGSGAISDGRSGGGARVQDRVTVEAGRAEKGVMSWIL